MLRYQWRDASPNTDGPIKSLPCDVKWRSLQVIFWKYFQSGLTKKLWKNNCNLAAVDNFSKLHMCLFTFWMNRFFSLSFVQCSVSRNVLSSGHITDISADVARLYWVKCCQNFRASNRGKLAFLPAARDFKVAQIFLSSNYAPNFLNLGAFQQ